MRQKYSEIALAQGLILPGFLPPEPPVSGLVELSGSETQEAVSDCFSTSAAALRTKCHEINLNERERIACKQPEPLQFSTLITGTVAISMTLCELDTGRNLAPPMECTGLSEWHTSVPGEGSVGAQSACVT